MFHAGTYTYIYRSGFHESGTEFRQKFHSSGTFSDQQRQADGRQPNNPRLYACPLKCHGSDMEFTREKSNRTEQSEKKKEKK